MWTYEYRDAEATRGRRHAGMSQHSATSPSSLPEVSMLDMMTLIYRVQYGGRKGRSAARRLLRNRAAYPTANPDWVRGFQKRWNARS